VTDLAAVCAAGKCAATTVSATATLAARAGIRLLSTGGIGGVHRGDASDVSSDLWVLAREPIAVVSAGPKAILDLARTAEALETFGVQVVGFGTDELPAFYSRGSGIALDTRVDTAGHAAAIVRARLDLSLGGVLIANPIPASAEIPAGELAAVIDAACAEATARRVSGKRLTPFLLSRLAEATGGRSVRANRALAVANAKLASEIALAL